MDFIFMLTRGDKTVEDCMDVLTQIAPLGLRHIGFKDVGVEPKMLHALTDLIRAMGATSYMEVVSETAEACLRSARVAKDLGVDRLLGGTDVARITEILTGTHTQYFPFPGFPSGHPTKLGGKPADVTAHCESFRRAGCAGADLLAFRATEADPLDLVRAARRGLGDGYLIVAGSITSQERIRAVSAAGADAFTIGTAVFDGSYNPRKGSLLSQLGDVLADCEAA
ncbi:MAG: 4-hydroxythreonine-4-phosphate dehydrogenase [Devosia sp.]